MTVFLCLIRQLPLFGSSHPKAGHIYMYVGMEISRGLSYHYLGIVGSITLYHSVSTVPGRDSKNTHQKYLNQQVWGGGVRYFTICDDGYREVYLASKTHCYARYGGSFGSTRPLNNSVFSTATVSGYYTLGTWEVNL